MKAEDKTTIALSQGASGDELRQSESDSLLRGEHLFSDNEGDALLIGGIGGELPLVGASASLFSEQSNDSDSMFVEPGFDGGPQLVELIPDYGHGDSIDLAILFHEPFADLSVPSVADPVNTPTSFENLFYTGGDSSLKILYDDELAAGSSNNTP